MSQGLRLNSESSCDNDQSPFLEDSSEEVTIQRHIWYVRDVENVSLLAEFMAFCSKIGFVTVYALLSQNLFCRDLRTFVWREKYIQKFSMWIVENEND